jgi:hypothetical protein
MSLPGFNDSRPPILRGDERTAKVLVAGHFGAGKTTFVHGLSQIAPVSTEEVMTSAGEGIDHSDLPQKLTTTVAMDFGRLHLADDLVLYLFGAPGQPPCALPAGSGRTGFMVPTCGFPLMFRAVDEALSSN